jgi:hypothetical protein
MTLVNDSLNVRVGGGYLRIDEFIENYAGVELEKLGRKEMNRKFQSPTKAASIY